MKKGIIMPSKLTPKNQQIFDSVSWPHEKPSLSFFHWFLWALSILFVIYQFVLRVSLGVMAQDLMAYFSIDATAFSTLGALFYLGYASMQIPIGVLLDRLGPARVTPACLFLCILGFICFVFSDNWSVILVGRLITGIGSAGAFISSLKIAQLVFPRRLFNLFVGLTASFGLSGAVFGGGPIKIFLEIYGLLEVLEGLVAIGIILCLIVGIVYLKSRAQEIFLSNSHHTVQGTPLPIFEGLRVIIKNPILLGLLFCTGLMTTGLYSFADAWGASFLETYQQTSGKIASLSISVIYIGMLIGATALGMIADKIGSSKEIVSLCGGISALILGALLTFHFSSSLILGLMFIFGICSSLQILVFSYILQLLPQRFGGIGSGTTNMTIMLLGSLCIYLIGFLMDLSWQGTMQASCRIYERESYMLAFGVIVGLIGIGTIGFSILSTHARRISHRFVHLEEAFNITN